MKWHPREGEVAKVKVQREASGDWVVAYPSTYGTLTVDGVDSPAASRKELVMEIEVLEPRYNRSFSDRARVLNTDVTFQDVEGVVGIGNLVTDPDFQRKAELRRSANQRKH